MRLLPTGRPHPTHDTFGNVYAATLHPGGHLGLSLVQVRAKP